MAWVPDAVRTTRYMAWELPDAVRTTRYMAWERPDAVGTTALHGVELPDARRNDATFSLVPRTTTKEQFPKRH